MTKMPKSVFFKVIQFYWIILILSRKEALSSSIISLTSLDSEEINESNSGSGSEESDQEILATSARGGVEEYLWFGGAGDAKVVGSNGGVRVVRDLIFFKNGVHLDFSYNETSSPGKFTSAPGCPRSIGGRPWLYYGSPPKCHLAGFQGPCSWGKRLFSINNSKYGVCNCDCFAFSSLTPATTSSVSISKSSSPSAASYIPKALVLPFEVPPKKLPIPPSPSPIDLDIGQNLIFSRRSARARIFTTIVTTAGGTRKVAYHTRDGPPLGRGIQRNENTDEAADQLLFTRSSFPGGQETEVASQSQPPQRYQFCHSDTFKRQVVFDSLRQECYPFLEQGPCLNDEWLVKDFQRERGIHCEKRKCPEFKELHAQGGNSEGGGGSGGGFTYFDYRKQECLTETYGSLQETFFSNAGSILTSRSQFCKEAGMKYSNKLKTCVKDTSQEFNFKVIG